jgi:glycosyltransferase involved in cell wall biosynthesis
VLLSLVFGICAGVLAIQLVYLIIFIIAFVRDHRAPVTNQQTGVIPAARQVSVIVCAHDEEENLRELIPVLLSQDHPDYEVIIVDDRSNDGTYDMLLRLTTENPKLRMVTIRETPKHMNGKKFALTMGIKAAKYDWVLLTDADCRPGSGWVNGMAQYFGADKNIVIGFSPYEKHPGVLNAFIRFESFVTAIQYLGLAVLGKPYMGVGRNLAYKRQLFLDSKGFNDHMDIVGGDDDLFVNQHATTTTTDAAMGNDLVVRSVPKKTWREFFDQKIRHLSVGKKYKFGDRFMLAVFTITWLVWPFVVVAIPFLGINAAIIGGLILARWIALGTLFRVAQRRLGEPFETWKTPFLDFIYAFYYLVAGPIALVTKRVRWKI